MKVNDSEVKMQETQGYANNSKNEVNVKNQMINQLRDDMKGLAVNKIKLSKKTVLQEKMLKTLQDQLLIMVEKAKKAGADVSDFKKVNIEVESETVDPAEL